MNLGRIKGLIDQAIRDFSLDLSGLTVLTEAATGYYAFTPIIAALAQAQSVLALTKDSQYGKSEDIREETTELARSWNVGDKLQVLFDRQDRRIPNADIVTNLGFVRPIDSDFLNRLRKTAVIPLMWETWEYRPEDLDLAECRRRGIPVLGTNEHHPLLRTFEYLGYVALKLLFEAEIEVFDAKIALLGEGEFASHVKNTLHRAHAHVMSIFENTIKDPIPTSYSILERSDALVVVEHYDRKPLIGEKALITGQELSRLNRNITIIHICGNVDYNDLQKNGVRCWPVEFAPPGRMSVGTDYVGPAPLIKLHTAGLKVGQSLAHAHRQGATSFDSEMKVLANLELAQGFKGFHFT